MKLLMHTCCAPCSVFCIESLRAEGIEPTVYWFNPNIHPYMEYKARRDCLKEYTKNINVKAITGGYSEETSNSNTTENKTVKTVSITLKSGNNTLYSDSGVDKNTTSKSTTISGKGSMDLTLTITDSNGGSWTRTKSVNFSTDSSVNFN